MHVLGDRPGAQHDAERVDGSVVDDGTSVRIGLVDWFKDIVLAPDDRQAGDDTFAEVFRFRRAITRPPSGRRGASPR